MLMAQVGFHEEEMEESNGDARHKSYRNNNQHTWSTFCTPGVVLDPVHM